MSRRTWPCPKSWPRGGQGQEAIACYRQVLRIQPDHVEALTRLGIAFGERELHEGAIGLFRRVLQLQPNSAQVLLVSKLLGLSRDFDDPRRPTHTEVPILTGFSVVSARSGTGVIKTAEEPI
jgi:tetratricopeptide (TPR) repeat protein